MRDFIFNISEELLFHFLFPSQAIHWLLTHCVDLKLQIGSACNTPLPFQQIPLFSHVQLSLSHPVVCEGWTPFLSGKCCKTEKWNGTVSMTFLWLKPSTAEHCGSISTDFDALFIRLLFQWLHLHFANKHDGNRVSLSGKHTSMQILLCHRVQVCLFFYMAPLYLPFSLT